MENKNLSLEQHSLGGCLPRSIVKQFFNYGETKMCAFARQNQKRIPFYKGASLQQRAYFNEVSRYFSLNVKSQLRFHSEDTFLFRKVKKSFSISKLLKDDLP